MSEVKPRNSEKYQLTPEEQAEALELAKRNKRIAVEKAEAGGVINKGDVQAMSAPDNYESATADLFALNKQVGASTDPNLKSIPQENDNSTVESIFHDSVTEGGKLMDEKGNDIGAHDALAALLNKLQK